MAWSTGRSLLDNLLLDHDEARFSDDDVRAFVDSMSNQVPADPELEWPVTWVNRARLLGDFPTAIKAIEAWNNSDDPPPARTLQYQYAWAHQYQEAVEAQRVVIAETDDASTLPSELARLVELERLAEDFVAAASDLNVGVQALERLKELGQDHGYHYQRRNTVEQGLLLAAADLDIDRARGLFDLVEPLGLWVSLPLVVLEAGGDAAAHIGDDARRNLWADRARDERARIDREMGRSSDGDG